MRAASACRASGGAGAGRPHADREGHGFGSRSPASLLTAAVYLRLEIERRSQNQRADPDRTTDLVGGERGEFGAAEVGGEVEPRGRLDGVGVKRDPGASEPLRDPRDRLHSASLVVGGHDRHDGSVGTSRLHHARWVDDALFVDVDDGDLGARALQCRRRRQYCRVLDRGDHHVVPVGAHATGEREVVGLRPSAREYDRTATTQLGHLRTRGLDRSTRGLPWGVDGAGLAGTPDSQGSIASRASGASGAVAL